jgi:iron(III) transport system substrate-binding protein
MAGPSTRREFLKLAGALSGGLLLAACGGGAAPSPSTSAAAQQAAPSGSAAIANLVDQWYAGAKKEGKVVWWDNWDEDMANKLSAGFAKRFPGITLEPFLGTTDDLKPRALAEARSGKVSFDVYLTSTDYPDYKKAGLVADNTQILDMLSISKDLRYQGTYTPIFFTVGATYNPKLVKESELPRSWDGFLDPKWKGKLAVESRLKMFVYATTFWGQDKVIDYLHKLKDQAPQFAKGDIAGNKLLVAGEYPVMISSYLTNYGRYVPQGAPWAFAPTEEVYVLNGPGYTTSANPPHPNAAKLFLYWFLSPDAQAILDERFSGNPFPGSDSGPAKFLQEHKITPKLFPSDEIPKMDDYTKKYQDAIGLPAA